MKVLVGTIQELPEIKLPRAVATEKKVIFGPNRCWETHVLRVYRINKNGSTPEDKHEWPHWVYVIRGQGVVRIARKEYQISEGSYMFIPGNELHNLENTTPDPLEFICIVPAFTEDF